MVISGGVFFECRLWYSSQQRIPWETFMGTSFVDFPSGYSLLLRSATSSHRGPDSHLASDPHSDLEANFTEKKGETADWDASILIGSERVLLIR